MSVLNASDRAYIAAVKGAKRKTIHFLIFLFLLRNYYGVVTVNTRITALPGVTLRYLYLTNCEFLFTAFLRRIAAFIFAGVGITGDI